MYSKQLVTVMLSLCSSFRPILPQDIDYNHLPAHASYHSAFAKSGIRRIMFEHYSNILGRILKEKEEDILNQNVWAIVFELENNPIFVMRNLAQSTCHPAYRRIYTIRIEDFRNRFD